MRLTQLIRSEEENKAVKGVWNSKHLTGEAADINPHTYYPKANWDQWRLKAKLFLDKHLNGVDCVVHGTGTNRHLHIEIDVKLPELDVRLT